MVNGKNVQTKTIIKVLSGEPLPKKSSSEGENSDFFAKIFGFGSVKYMAFLYIGKVI